MLKVIYTASRITLGSQYHSKEIVLARVRTPTTINPIHNNVNPSALRRMSTRNTEVTKKKRSYKKVDGSGVAKVVAAATVLTVFYLGFTSGPKKTSKEENDKKAI